jgi:IclR family mhp operon transcriptional activator
MRLMDRTDTPEERGMDERQEIKSLKKALRALTFLNNNGESTVTQVACAIGVPRTTSYRLLETLASEGYVEKQAHSDVYRLTSLVQRLSSGFGDADLVVEVAKPLVRRVGEDIGWPVALAIPRGKDMVVRISTDHDTSLAIDRYTIGFATPILHSPTGLCYLAYCDDEARDAIVQQSNCADSVSEPIGADRKHLDYLLNQVRVRGFSHIRFAEYREGGLAVPLVIGGRVIGGLVMRYIKTTLKLSDIQETFFPILQQLAEDIAAAYEVRVSRRTLQSESVSQPAMRRALDAWQQDRTIGPLAH